MSEPTKATVRERRGISRIWLVPAAAMVLGLWMVVYTWANQGPEVTIVFPTAEGIEAGKTKIKARSVVIGVVTTVVLGEDLKTVEVSAELDLSAERLLREDTEFWVVRARVGSGGVSGVGTILSGGYIELAPGEGKPGRRKYVGLDDVPATPVGTPGLRLALTSDRAGSVSAGNPILYKGFQVGRVETAELDLETQQMRYALFIDAPYDTLVTSATRFWDTSGVSFHAGADGIELSTGSLRSMLMGGIAFGLPEGVMPGSPVENGTAFALSHNQKAVNERPYVKSLPYVVLFESSVRGLQPGAPVDFRGIRVGRVDRILMDEFSREVLEVKGAPIPVLIHLEPGRLLLGDNEQGAALLKRAVEDAVGRGMHASLATGNLLTGGKYISLNTLGPDHADTLGSFAGYETLPTTSTGLEGIAQQVSTLLDKVNQLPIGDVVAGADRSLAQLEGALRELRRLLASDDLQALPASLNATIAELEATLASVSPNAAVDSRLSQTIADLDRTLKAINELVKTLSDKPNSLIFSGSPEQDPSPPAGNP